MTGRQKPGLPHQESRLLPDPYLAELLAAFVAGEPLTRAELRDVALEVLRPRHPAVAAILA